MTHEQMAYLLEIEPWRLEEDAEIGIMDDYGWMYTDEAGIGWYCYKDARMENLLMARYRLRLMEPVADGV